MNRCARTAITLALFSLIAATAWADAPNAAREVAVPGEASPSVVSPLASPRVPLGGVLYDNGSLVTHPGGGSGGADASSLQDTSLLMTIFGFGHALAANIRVADDFTVPAGGWNVSQIVFFAYQTGSSTTSTINHVNLQIWDGPPGAPSNIVFGDTATNRLATSTFSNVYRTLESAGQAGTTRPLMANATTVSTFLPAGTYWVDWQTGGTLGSGPWVAPVTILGQTGKPGANGLQALTPGVWSAALDVAAQDFPFIIEGTPGGCTLTCPADQNANTDAGVCTATVNYPAPTTSGSCGPIVCTPAAGSSFGLGVTAVNCVDEGQPGFGPQASCSFNVTVTDIEPPAISCPADINQEIPVGEIDGTVVWPAPTVSDNCSVGSPTCTPPSGSLFPLGTSGVNCSVSDGGGAQATCGFDVTLVEGAGGGSVLEIPTLGGVGLAAMAAALFALGLFLLRRRERSSAD